MIHLCSTHCQFHANQLARERRCLDYKNKCVDCGNRVQNANITRCWECSCNHRKSTPKKHSTEAKAKMKSTSLARYQNANYKEQWQLSIDKRTKDKNWIEKQQAGSVNRSKNPEYLKKLRLAALDPEVKQKWLKAMESHPTRRKGQANPNWKGNGNRNERALAFDKPEYKEWRRLVFKRDDFTCQRCFKYAGTLHAHHVIPWQFSVELRYEVSNGETVCPDCHRKIHSKGKI